MSKEIRIIYEACIGCGKCFALCPKVFSLDDDGFAFIKDVKTIENEDITKQINQAKVACPTKAIQIG